jgi:hypothetical protein
MSNCIISQIVQEEGDLIIIPPNFWHQVYHLQPSIAVASQYVNDVVKDRVFDHILAWCSGKDAVKDRKELRAKLPENFAKLSDEEQVKAVIKTGLTMQHGPEKAGKLMEKLLKSNDGVDVDDDSDEPSADDEL